MTISKVIAGGSSSSCRRRQTSSSSSQSTRTLRAARVDRTDEIRHQRDQPFGGVVRAVRTIITSWAPFQNVSSTTPSARPSWLITSQPTTSATKYSPGAERRQRRARDAHLAVGQRRRRLARCRRPRA